jgi:hypothetical protein
MKDDKLHNCEYSRKLVMIDGPSGQFYGPAIIRCRETDGAFFVDNEEYCSQVNFCPYCGAEATTKVEYKDAKECEDGTYGV